MIVVVVVVIVIVIVIVNFRVKKRAVNDHSFYPLVLLSIENIVTQVTNCNKQ